MIRSIKSNFILGLRNCYFLHKCNRTYLSESYNCLEAWNRRHQSPVLSKFQPKNLLYEIDQQLQSTGIISAVDVDIFVNVMKDPEYVDEVTSIIQKLRMTAETTNTLESTHHAFIRYLLDCGDEQLLLDVLHDRLNYGIFSDHYCYSLMMNRFITKNDFASSAKIATLLMLQEDASHAISNAFGVYSCYKFLDNPNQWTLPTPQPVNPKEEVIKVRVHYLRNPYFDDHFDLVDPIHLVGKTLVFFGKLIDDPLGRTCQLRGYILWMKHKYAAEAIKNWIERGIKEIVYSEVLPAIEKELSTIPEDKVTDDIKELIKQLEKLKNLTLKDGSIIEEMEKRLRETVAEKESADIMIQSQIYEEWEKKRINSLQKQMNDLNKKARLEKIKKMKQDLETRERLLTFFEREEEIELRIEQKLAADEEKYGPYIPHSEDNEENYIPPEIKKQPMPKQK